MATKLKSPQDVFHHKLGATLKMEKTVLQMLGELEENAQRDQLKQQFSHHADETREQIQNIEKAFEVLGEEPTENPCPAIQGIQQEGKTNMKAADESVVDAVILAGAAETEHHEIAVYEGLITDAEAMGNKDIVRLLQQNLEQEQHTLEEVKHATQELAQEQFSHAA